MVTGKVPFDAPTPSAVMHKHLKEELVPPDHLNPTLSAGVGEIIEVAMSKSRKKRYQTAEDMLTDLERVAAGEPPLIAKKTFDLSQLADLENTGVASASQIQKSNNAVPIDAQQTIDVDARTLGERLMDPIVLTLGGLSFVLVVVLVIVLAIKK